MLDIDNTLDFEEDSFYTNTESGGRIAPPLVSEDIDGLDDIPAPKHEKEGTTANASEEEVEEAPFLSAQGDFGDLEVEDEDEESTNVGDESLFSAEERLSRFGDILLSACFKDSDIRMLALDTLASLPSPSIFRDENYILLSVLFSFKNRLRRIKIDEELIRLFLNRSRKLILNSSEFIDINAYGEIDGSNVLGYISGVIKHYRRLLTLDDVDESEYLLTMEKYLVEYKTLEAEKVLQNARLILTDSLSAGKKKLSGFEDSQNYIKREMSRIEGLVTMNQGTGFTTHREMLQKDKSTKPSIKVSDFGKIKSLNEVYSGIYTGMFYEVIAPPKAGKSKFMTRICHTSIAEYGTNVTVWAVEGGNDAFLAQLRAIHFDWVYNTGVDMVNKKYGVSQEAIYHDRFPSDELRAMEESSKVDLASNEDYGVVDFIDRPFKVETFLDDIDASVKSNNSKIIFIDYLQMISSIYHNVSSREAVSDAYQSLLQYCRLNNVAVFTPAQYKQETFDKLMESKTGSGIDLRTAGGVSSEVIRTPDVFFAMWATTEDIANNVSKILSMPGRFCKPFPDIDLVTNLETCQFIG